MTVSGRLRRSQAASVTTGQQVKRGGVKVLRASLQRSWCWSSSERMATIGPVSISTRSATSEAFHVIGVGAEVGGQVFGRADQPEPLREVAAIGGWRPRAHVFFQCLADNIRRADAFFSGFGFQFLFEPLIDPDVDSFHRYSLFDHGDRQTQ